MGRKSCSKVLRWVFFHKSPYSLVKISSIKAKFYIFQQYTTLRHLTMITWNWQSGISWSFKWSMRTVSSLQWFCYLLMILSIIVFISAWFYGKIEGTDMCGLFPVNCVQIIDADMSHPRVSETLREWVDSIKKRYINGVKYKYLFDF